MQWFTDHVLRPNDADSRFGPYDANLHIQTEQGL